MQGSWRENLIKIKPYVAGEQSNDKDMIKLNANENPYPPSPQVKKVFEKYAENSEGLKKYPNSDSIKRCNRKKVQCRQKQCVCWQRL